ncbi:MULTISPECIES: hypothetical protein [Chromohalobacter]|uniref:Uncharacterized protein n=1 Tax=Chromohalobacter israelensis (strain ATCC BAA-138 / DSM 3043 / CIP 106854 / NCIMB 13768 / 1H11) TaxID=290398 RepID=Q1QVH5_CHRI1|nr:MULTISPECIES: hypothetical protein [Chromohalobacter]ABE59533.1 hypothetical protein Csal_2182 [Chromohalobacter salexigens DSM 3043]MBZ5874697.1 hypothetical protein [Chromohalobacter salexigens]MDF9433502.1 hypothetical protein [Chromohalobacter israelensis]MDO0946322.1 hypothetical protein [Chromohalobacter salexigens]NQY46118.1 hypothetical protein [Chromohalobacter sp.]
MTSATHDSPASPRRVRARHRAQWWLAGLLVGCLLPAGLMHPEALRIAERLTQICLMAPEVIRAQSRRVAHRRRLLTGRRRPFTPRRVRLPRRVCHLMSVGVDTLSRRGPPSTACVHGSRRLAA